jgi:hypothetical protein
MSVTFSSQAELVIDNALKICSILTLNYIKKKIFSWYSAISCIVTWLTIRLLRWQAPDMVVADIEKLKTANIKEDPTS